MINAIQVLERMGIDQTSATRAIQEVRERVNGADNKLKAAVDIIMNITGETVEFNNEDTALHVAQGVVSRAIAQGANFEPHQAIVDATSSAEQVRNNPDNSWFWPQSSKTAIAQGPMKQIGGVDVEMKADGSIKKGGRKEGAMALFKEHVIGAKVSNGAFVSILEKELGMSKAGATTYAYNVRKEYEAQTGTVVDIEKSKKGRKPKAAA
jgi:hypothetical protein